MLIGDDNFCGRTIVDIGEDKRVAGDVERPEMLG
jgi:hypothetical protein